VFLILCKSVQCINIVELDLPKLFSVFEISLPEDVGCGTKGNNN
jgi:hypothetical protein